MSVKAYELLKQGAKRLKNAGIRDWDYDSRALLEWCCNINRMDLILDPAMKVEQSFADNYNFYIQKRALHEPLQYLIGEWEFMGLPFKVNPSVLIPRQDTEVLVEWILEQEGREGNSGSCKCEMTLLDVCTGSGCIAISMDVLWPEKNHASLTVEALDISKGALETARMNNELNHASVRFYESNMFSNIREHYDIIVSNPPYIPTKVVEGLMVEVVEFEPRLALDGLEDGLHFYRILAKEGKNHLKPGGRIYLEIGHDQGKSVPEILEQEGFSDIELRQDLAGNDRCVRAVFPG